MNYYPTIGLEIHVELGTKSKMFCSCKNDSDEKSPNVNICPICLGHPGTLPVINSEAVKKVIRTAFALNCEIQKKAYFERKNYFYPDLPKGYQISQYAAPLSKNGYLNLSGNRIRIERIHLEEDTGRLIHPQGTDYSLIDFNRAGIPLMELVTEPEIHSAQKAREFVRELQLILRYLGVSDANMEKGELRAEVNISLKEQKHALYQNKVSGAELGTKVEIKNLNSLKAVKKAIEYEIKRQKEVLENGKLVIQETRGWKAKGEITISQRKKEEAHDYRYFPEPDLLPLDLDEKFLREIKAEIPELPQERRKRFQKEYGLDEKSIDALIFNKNLGEYFENVTSELRAWVREKKNKLEITEEEFKKLAKLTVNYILTDLQGLLKDTSVKKKDFLITPENFAEFISMIYTGEISSKIAKTLLKEMFDKGTDPSQIIEKKNLNLVSDEEELERIIKEVLSKNPKPVEDYKKGKKTALQFLIGQVMAQTKGKANPKLLSKILEKLMD